MPATMAEFRSKGAIMFRVRRGSPAAVQRRALHREPARVHRRVSGRAHGPSGAHRGAGRRGEDRAGEDAVRDHGAPLIRLQCYEGLDEGKALYEWKYAKQLLYTQLLAIASAS